MDSYRCFVITMHSSDYKLKQQTFAWKFTIFSRFVLTPSPLNRQSLLRYLKVFCWRSLTNIKIKDINIKILCFFIHAFPQMFFDPKKTPKKWQFIFIYNNYINIIYTWGNFDQPIKVTPGTIKVTPSVIKVTPFDGKTLIGLSFRIS